MKKLVSFVLVFATLFLLCGCNGYTSSYSAVGLVKSNTSHSCKASFHSLKGQLVFKIRKSDGGEGDISYSLEAEEGEIKLSYDIYGTKEELATVKAGEAVSTRGGYIEGGKAVYIIIEAAEKSRGKVSVELDS